MKLVAIIVMLTCAIFLAGCSGETKLENSILNKKPVFTIDLHGAGTRFQLYLNGV